jgi:hypothetical protein
MIMKLFKSKKGYKTIITIFAVFVILFTFITFAWLFKSASDPGKPENEVAFNSIDTELVLKTFLNTPSEVGPEEVGLPVGTSVSSADLITHTCPSTKEVEMAAPFMSIFKPHAEAFFKRRYNDKWHLEVIYYIPDGDGEITPAEVRREPIGRAEGYSSIGSAEFRKELSAHSGDDPIFPAIALLKVNLRQKGFASQILPCKEPGTIVKLVLIAEEPKNSKWPGDE